MARIQYVVTNFNSEKAKAYSLVAMVKTEVTSNTMLYNIDEQGIPNASFKGAGIVRYKANNSTFEFWYDGQTYPFSISGQSISTLSEGYKLMMAKVNEDVKPSGNAVTGTNTGITERDEYGNIISGGVTYGDRTILIESQNARDQFATEILNSILQKLDADPSFLDSSTRSHYCQVAYDWAANMMTAAANARGTFRDETESATSQMTAVGSLENNTDKLINNLIVALERIQTKKIVDNKEVYAQSIEFDGLDPLMDKMDYVITALTALKDNVTNAMTNMQQVMTQHLGAFNQMVEKLGFINSSILGFTQNINNNFTTVNNNVTSLRSDLSSIDNDIDTVVNGVTTLQGTTNTIKTNVDTIKSDVAIIKQNTNP